MHIGTQLVAPDGYDCLKRGVTYYLLRSDARTQRSVLVEFCQQEPKKRKRVSGRAGGKDTTVTADSAPASSNDLCLSWSKPRPVLHFMSQARFELGLEEAFIIPSPAQQELPPWLDGLTIHDLQAYAEERPTRKKSHSERIDQMLVHLWPLVQNLDQVLAADMPDAVINAHARACRPQQNETRLRTAFYAYTCFGFCRWALHYAVQRIGRWERIGRDQKFGRPSKVNGEYHGYGSNDPEMIQMILEGYRKFAGPGQHMSKIYRRTMRTVFGCVSQTDGAGRKYFIHPAGRPFPTLGQFIYRVAQEYPLEARQIYKFGYARVRTRLQHSKGRFAESVGNLMERTEQDAYCCKEVAKGYLPGTHHPPVWVVRTRCITSGMIVGIGFSVGSEAASAYRMAKFCEAIDKVVFCRLLGLNIRPEDWPSVGVSPHVINDRGPGSTAKAEAADPALRPTIKESAPSYSGQSKASIETTHPKHVKLEGKPAYVETRLSIPQLAVQEVLRTIGDNHSIDVNSRLNNEAVIDRVFPTPISVWNYLDRRGRNHALPMSFEAAVRAYLTPIELTVRDDAVYFKEMRFNSEALQQSKILQRAHSCGNFKLKGFMLDVCVRHLWLDLGGELIEVDAMLAIRDGQEQLYISVIELEQLEQLRRNEKLALKTHQLAARSEFEAQFEAHTGQLFEQGVIKGGRSKRSKAASLEEGREILRYLRAIGGGR